MKVLDTNVLLRFLLGDDPAQSAAAARYLKKALAERHEPFVADLVVAEAVWVMEGRKVPRPLVVRHLQNLLEDPRFDVENRGRLLAGLAHYLEHRVDFADAYLAALAQEKSSDVVSFDRDFDRLPVRREEPS